MMAMMVYDRCCFLKTSYICRTVPPENMGQIAQIHVEICNFFLGKYPYPDSTLDNIEPEVASRQAFLNTSG